MTTIADLPVGAKLNTAVGAWTFGNDIAGNNQVIGRWRVPYADLADFRVKCLYTPATIIINPDPLIEITRVHPLVCPLDPTLLALSVEGSNFQPNQTASPGPWTVTDGVYSPHATNPPFPLWDVVVRFGRAPYQTSGDRPFMDITEESRVDRRTVPNHPYELIDEAGAHVEWVAQDLGLPAGSSQYRVTWHEITDLPAAQEVFQPILDKTNDEEVTIPFIGAVCAPGTLHCSTKASSVSVSYGANVKSTLSVVLAHHPRGVNRAVASADGFAGQFLRINAPDLGAGWHPPIELADYGPMFNPTV